MRNCKSQRLQSNVDKGYRALGAKSREPNLASIYVEIYKLRALGNKGSNAVSSGQRSNCVPLKDYSISKEEGH